MPITRQVDRAVKLPVTELRHELQGFGWRDDLHLHADAPGLAHAALQLLELFLTGGKAQAADMSEQSQLAVQLDGILAELQHGLGRGELRHHPGCMRRLAAGDLALFEQDDILLPQL